MIGTPSTSRTFSMVRRRSRARRSRASRTVKALRARVDSTSATDRARLIGQAMVACDRLEKLLAGIDTRGTAGDRDALQRVASAASGFVQMVGPASLTVRPHEAG